MNNLAEAEKIWVYQGEHDKEPMLAREGIGVRPATEAEVLLCERISALERELQGQIMREEALATRPIEFTESDGTLRKLIYDKGDESVGIFPGYDAEDTLVEDLRRELRRAQPLVDAVLQWHEAKIKRSEEDIGFIYMTATEHVSIDTRLVDAILKYTEGVGDIYEVELEG
jgi:hypothetical protein